MLVCFLIQHNTVGKRSQINDCDELINCHNNFQFRGSYDNLNYSKTSLGSSFIIDLNTRFYHLSFFTPCKTTYRISSKIDSENLNLLLCIISLICLFKIRQTKLILLIVLIILKWTTMKYHKKSVHFDIIRNICCKCNLFSLEFLEIRDHFDELNLKESAASFIFSKYNFRNNYSYFGIILLLSGDVSRNPGPQYDQNEIINMWKFFQCKGVHIIHLNVNSLLPKIDEIRFIAEKSAASIIGISETKLDISINDLELQIDGYNLLRADRNRHGGGVACYIKNNISFEIKKYFPPDIENLFVDIVFPNSKPFTVGILYRPPIQNNFLEILNEHFDQINSENKEL